MKKVHRKIIFIIFVLFFLITIPAILIYTAGYRYNFKKIKFEKTGSLIVSTKTKNVILNINNKSQTNRDEFRISNFLPGEYLINISKEGHFDWQKKINIDSEYTTFIKNLRLFKKNLPINIVQKNITSIFPNENKDRVMYATLKDNLYTAWLLDLSGQEPKQIFQTNQKIENITWSKDGDKIVIETATQFRIFNIQESEIKITLPTPLSKLYWDNKNNNILYALKKDGIYQVDLFFKNYKQIYKTKESIIDFKISDNNIYFVDGYTLKQIDIKNGNIIPVPLERKGYIVNNIKNKKAYLKNSNGKMQIFNLPLTESSTPLLLVNATDFNALGDNLVFHNEFELWTFNFVTGEKKLITRIGTEIKKAFWANNTKNIIFLVGDQIKIIELDKADKRQVIELLKFEKINDMFLTENYNLFFTGKINKTEGLYKLDI